MAECTHKSRYNLGFWQGLESNMPFNGYSVNENEPKLKSVQARTRFAYVRASYYFYELKFLSHV